MPQRIHEYSTVLKTLFRFMVPKPRNPIYADLRNGVAHAESMKVTILFFDKELSERFFADPPPYVIRWTFSDSLGYMVEGPTPEDEDPPDWSVNESFEGSAALVELHPMYDKAAILEDMRRKLQEISAEWAEANGIEVDWEEDYAYFGAQVNTMASKIQRPGR